jgi:chromosome segregation ATPase
MAAAPTGIEKVSYMKKKIDDLSKALATEAAKSAGLELTVGQQRQEIDQMRLNMENISKEKETFAKGLEERDLEIGHLAKRLKSNQMKIARLEKDYEKSTANYLSKLKKKDLRIGDITKELAETNNELEETIVKFEKMKQATEDFQDTLNEIDMSPPRI